MDVYDTFVRFGFRRPVSGFIKVDYAISYVPLNEWHMITGTFDGTDLRLYIDGEQKAVFNSPGVMATGSTPIYIGSSDGGTETDRNWDGDLDDVRIYNRALSAAEVAALYNYKFCKRPREREGTITYNHTYDVFQSCTEGRWVALHEIDQPTGLVGHWGLDETSGTIAADSSGNGNDGTMAGDLSATNDSVRGQAGRALDFDGTDDYIQVANEANFDFERTDPFSLSAWFYRDTNTTEDDIIEKFTPSTGYYLYLPDNIDRLFFGLRNDGSVLEVYNNYDLSLGEWHHVVVTYDGSSDAAVVAMYLDGVAQSLGIYENSLSSGSILNNSPLVIGNERPSTSCCVFDGLIDDVRVYDRALSEAEAQSLYQAGSGGNVCSNPDGKLGEKMFNTTHNKFQGCTLRGWMAFH